MSAQTERSETTPRTEPCSDSVTQPEQGAFHFMIHAQAEASALSRILEHFALRDFVPDEVGCKRTAAEELHIHIAVSGMPANQAANLAARFRNIVPVLRVALEPAPNT